MTPARRFAATHLTTQADQLAGAITPPPAGLPAGLRITLLADYHRVRDAAENACLLAWADISWEADYAHLATEDDPQVAATEHALDEARAYLTDYRTVLQHAGTLLIPAA
jgi:hypothetical protein